jgi:hypothetical protein
MAEPTWTPVTPASPGEHLVTCVQAGVVTSTAGNECVRWVFELPGGVRLAWTTVRRRRETGIAARALGLKYPPLRLAAAAASPPSRTARSSASRAPALCSKPPPWCNSSTPA